MQRLMPNLTARIALVLGFVKRVYCSTTAYRGSERDHVPLEDSFVNVAIQTLAALHILLECKVFLCVDSF